MVRKLLFAVLAALSFALPARAQQPGFPQNLPPNTVYGRSAIGTGPGQAIPFSSIVQVLTNQSNTWTFPQAFTGGPISFTGPQSAPSSDPAAVQLGLSGGCQATWLIAITLPCGPYMLVYGPNGGGAAAFANRSSDYIPAGPSNATPTQDLITSAVYALHDNTANSGYFGIWTNYWVAERTATANPAPIVQILEASFVNNGSSVVNDPFTFTADGTTVGISIDSGVGLVGPNSVSDAIHIANNGADFLAGIAFGTNALHLAASGFYEAIQLSSSPTGSSGAGQAIMWYSAASTISGIINVNTSGVMQFHGSNGVQTGDTFSSLVATAPSSTAGFAYGFSSTAGLGIYFGTGAPSASAAKGSIYSRTDGGLGNLLYVNSSGSTTWTPIPAGVGVSQTCTVNTASPLTLIFTNGILTGGTCQYLTSSSLLWLRFSSSTLPWPSNSRCL